MFVLYKNYWQAIAEEWEIEILIDWFDRMQFRRTDAEKSSNNEAWLTIKEIVCIATKKFREDFI